MNGHGDFKQYGPQAKWLFLRRSPVREHGVLHEAALFDISYFVMYGWIEEERMRESSLPKYTDLSKLLKKPLLAGCLKTPR
jgi:hypothetical protein